MISDLKNCAELLVTDTSLSMEWQVLPKWIEFMIWAGWKMHATSLDSRQIMVLLLPERYCCSAFCSLGAIVAGSTIARSSVMWDEFLKFNEGGSIYLLYNHKGKTKPIEATIGSYSRSDDIDGRWVVVKSKNKSLDGLSILMTKNNIDGLQISNTPHASQIKLGKLNKISKFYNQIINGYQESWIVKSNIESVIVTNKAAWTRQIEEVHIAMDSELLDSVNDKDKYELRKLLMTGDCEDSSASHTRIVSTTSADKVDKIPLTIMDGVDALARWESYLQSNLIVLLSRAEYTEEAENILSMLSSHREDDLVKELHIDPIEIMPSDTEMALFALPSIQEK